MIEAALDRDRQNRIFENTMRQFGEIIMAEPAILAQLDEARDAQSFTEIYCRLAAERGLHFSHDDLRIAIQEQKHGSNWVIPKVVLNIVRELF